MAAAAMSVVYVLTTPIPEDGGDDPTVEQVRKRNKKELWDSLEAKYMAKDASSKKFFVSNFCIKFMYPLITLPSWKDFKHTLKHLKEELTLVKLGSHLRIEESHRVQDSDKPKSNNVVGPHSNIKNDMVSNIKKDMVSNGNKKYFVTFIDDASRAVVRLLDPKLKTLGERGIECIFVGYAEHFNAFRFYVIEPNDSVAINLIIKLKDAIFDENRFSSVPRPSLNIPKGTKDIGGSVFPEVVTDEVVQQYEFELRKSKRNRTPKDFGPEFQLYLIEGTKDEDAAFWKEAINDEMSSIMGNNTWVLADLPSPGLNLTLDCKSVYLTKENNPKVDGTIEKFKARLVIQGFKKSYGNYSLHFETYAPCGQLIST
ncbi:zinc finger, CCHC-type containing protein [Tanacetum coccineum]